MVAEKEKTRREQEKTRQIEIIQVEKTKRTEAVERTKRIQQHSSG